MRCDRAVSLIWGVPTEFGPAVEGSCCIPLAFCRDIFWGQAVVSLPLPDGVASGEFVFGCVSVDGTFKGGGALLLQHTSLFPTGGGSIFFVLFCIWKSAETHLMRRELLLAVVVSMTPGGGMMIYTPLDSATFLVQSDHVLGLRFQRFFSFTEVFLHGSCAWLSRYDGSLNFGGRYTRSARHGRPA